MAAYIVNETTNVTDFYPFMTDSNTVKWVAWAFSCLVAITGPCALYSVIWFERFGSDRKRTLLNMLFSQSCTAGIVYVYVAHIPELIRYVYGPMSSSVCVFQMLARFSLTGMGGFFLNAILITR